MEKAIIEKQLPFQTGAGKPSSLKGRLEQANKELWLIFSMVLLAGVMNYLLLGQRMMLGLYTLPTLYSAYFYGRSHATLTAFASVLLIGILAYFKPTLFEEEIQVRVFGLATHWLDIIAWGGILVITGYAMGTLYDRNLKKMEELRQAYSGVLHILRLFVSKDKYTENHSYRVSIYAMRISAHLGLDNDQIEVIRGAALLHDIGKLDISRKLLYKAARLSHEERKEISKHTEKGSAMIDSLGSPLNQIIPLILAHHDKYQGGDGRTVDGEKIPFKARIISVADVYDALTSDRPYRKAMSPLEAKEIIVKGSGADFDPKVVKAFIAAYESGEMEVPEIVL